MKTKILSQDDQLFPLKKNVSIASIGNYQIGGFAKYLSEPKNLKEAQRAVQWARKSKINILVWGSGTNILPRDEGFDGLIIHPHLLELKVGKSKVIVGSGVLVSDLLKFTIRKKLSGLEWAGGLPGTIGGAIRGNAGCFGGEIKDSIQSVTSLNIKTGLVKTFTKEQCRFGYRQSIFKRQDNQHLILSATFKLHPGKPLEIREKIEERIAYRLNRHPMDYPNIGSMFKNVPWKKIPSKFKSQFKPRIKKDPFPVIPTAILLSECQLRGKTIGGAKISEKHPNFIINFKKAKAREVRELLRIMKTKVYQKFGIQLELEVIILEK
ncbi:MAG: UDP-N-acetylmuramate dehydrogenase [Anaplasmataceae bacterium]|nr:UDP-N-acetylmuramate dehydrogenase [Anaplasmataceae bacterium]